MAKNAKAVPELVDNALILGDKAPPFSKEEVIQIIAHSKNLSKKKMLNLLAVVARKHNTASLITSGFSDSD